MEMMGKICFAVMPKKEGRSEMNVVCLNESIVKVKRKTSRSRREMAGYCFQDLTVGWGIDRLFISHSYGLLPPLELTIIDCNPLPLAWVCRVCQELIIPPGPRLSQNARIRNPCCSTTLLLLTHEVASPERVFA